jgi:hypothetical protein
MNNRSRKGALIRGALFLCLALIGAEAFLVGRALADGRNQVAVEGAYFFDHYEVIGGVNKCVHLFGGDNCAAGPSNKICAPIFPMIHRQAATNNVGAGGSCVGSLVPDPASAALVHKITITD